MNNSLLYQINEQLGLAHHIKFKELFIKDVSN
jgi:hypothetical protein